MSELLSCPLTLKMRTGYDMNTPTAHRLIPKLCGWGAAAPTPTLPLPLTLALTLTLALALALALTLTLT